MKQNTDNLLGNSGAAVKPLLRGWFHAVAAVGSLVLTVLMGWLSWDEWPKLVAMLVFGISMVEMYTVSAIYHIGRWREKSHSVLRALDHSNIFLLIAGTYTPLGYVMLGGWARIALLVVIWLLAALGVLVSVFFKQSPRGLRASLYVVMGWVAVLAMPAFMAVLPIEAVGLLLLGGLLNTVGAAIYARRKPNPFPRVLGFHELFHLFVIAGSVSFATVVVVWVLPTTSS